MNSPRMSTKYHCVTCQRPDSKLRCTGCRAAHYCGSECQRIDWEMGGHRLECINGYIFPSGGTPQDVSTADMSKWVVDPTDELERGFRGNILGLLVLDYRDGRASLGAPKRLIEFFAQNGVSANELMVKFLSGISWDDVKRWTDIAWEHKKDA